MVRTAADLSRRTRWLLGLVIVVGLLHHTDHVLRVDHSGWPFTPEPSPFTYSLMAYPIVLFALFGPPRWFWLRWAGLLLGAVFVVFAHTLIETPMAQYAIWATGFSTDPQAAGVQNLLCIRSPTIGVVAVILSMALNLSALAATLSMLWDRLGRLR
jgi:hypothetical protein